MPPKEHESSGSTFIDLWNDNERSLRLALGKVRAEKMKKLFVSENMFLPAEHVKVAGAAIEIDNPMEAEKYLNGYRLEFLETLRPMDTFSEDYIFYYGLRLKLLLRIRQFDKTVGEEAYKNIYSSVLNGDGMEGR